MHFWLRGRSQTLPRWWQQSSSLQRTHRVNVMKDTFTLCVHVRSCHCCCLPDVVLPSTVFHSFIHSCSHFLLRWTGVLQVDVWRTHVRSISTRLILSELLQTWLHSVHEDNKLQEEWRPSNHATRGGGGRKKEIREARWVRGNRLYYSTRPITLQRSGRAGPFNWGVNSRDGAADENDNWSIPSVQSHLTFLMTFEPFWNCCISSRRNATL